jgi:hypothetical protein
VLDFVGWFVCLSRRAEKKKQARQNPLRLTLNLNCAQSATLQQSCLMPKITPNPLSPPLSSSSSAGAPPPHPRIIHLIHRPASHRTNTFPAW